jgi:AMP-binding enzyme
MSLPPTARCLVLGWVSGRGVAVDERGQHRTPRFVTVCQQPLVLELGQAVGDGAPLHGEPVDVAVGEQARRRAAGGRLPKAGGRRPAGRRSASTPRSAPDARSPSAGRRDGARAGRRLAPTDLAVVPFSSGTGGLPKGVRLTHANLAASSAQVAASLGFDADTVALAAVPFSHVMGLGLSLCVPLRVGARIVTLPVPDTGRVLELTARHRVTHATVPVPISTELATDPGSRATTPPPWSCSPPPARACLPRWRWRPAGACAPWRETSRPDTPASSGSGGPQVMDGYFDDPAATAAAITADGWLRTGDLVTVGGDGRLVVEDRLKELIKVDGVQVARPSRSSSSASTPRSATRPWSADPTQGPARFPSPTSSWPGRPPPRSSSHSSPRTWLTTSNCATCASSTGCPRMPSGKLQRHLLRDRERQAAAAGARARGR